MRIVLIFILNYRKNCDRVFSRIHMMKKLLEIVNCQFIELSIIFICCNKNYLFQNNKLNCTINFRIKKHYRADQRKHSCTKKNFQIYVENFTQHIPISQRSNNRRNINTFPLPIFIPKFLRRNLHANLQTGEIPIWQYEKIVLWLKREHFARYLRITLAFTRLYDDVCTK